MIAIANLAAGRWLRASNIALGALLVACPVRAEILDATSNPPTTHPNGGVARPDRPPPTVTITSAISSVENNSLTLGGTVSANEVVTRVSWTSSQGGSGTATGTTSWTVSGIVLQPGTNVLTVTATDAGG